jgi:hypothetical protein
MTHVDDDEVTRALAILAKTTEAQRLVIAHMRVELERTTQMAATNLDGLRWEMGARAACLLEIANQQKEIVGLRQALLDCAQRLSDSMDVIVDECSPDEEDIERETEFIKEIRKLAISPGRYNFAPTQETISPEKQEDTPP